MQDEKPPPTLTIPCGQNGCGENRACCRPDCPIMMIEDRGSAWRWERRDVIRAALKHWMDKQEPLGKDFEKVLHRNLWDLYVRSQPYTDD